MTALVLVPPVESERPMVHELPIDGAIVVEPRTEDPEILALRQRGLPVVAIGRYLGANTPFIDLHSAISTRMLLDHLWQSGARRIALMIGQQERNAQVESEKAYRAFASESAMAACIVRVPEVGGEASAYAATMDCLQQDPQIDALLVGIDTMAVGALAAARALGRRVPEDLRLATRYDGVRARECTPALTALDVNLSAVAGEAVRLILDHIRGRRSIREVAAPLPRLVVRGSSVTN